jgi:hypothetical protein
MSATGLTVENLKDVRWRLSNLYHVIDENGEDTLFVPNKPQMELLNEMWFRNVLLKGRKIGFTTFFNVVGLDRCLFAADQDAQFLSETMNTAMKMFLRTIKHAYPRLPLEIQELVPLKSDNARQMVFQNGSVISVGTKPRGSNPTFLHISEYGPISAKFPDKARDIKTGAIQAVASGGNQMVFVESTAMGRVGEFKDMVDRARKLKDRGVSPSKLDMKFLFFPWYVKESNRLFDSHEPIPEVMQEYFRKLGVDLDDAQKRWYSTQYEILGPDMLVENPSTPDEPFSVSIEGAYFALQFRRVYSQGRICKLDIVPEIPVMTSWDIGMHDYMAIWFWQVVGGYAHVVDYYENNDQGLEHYVDVLQQKGYWYGTHYAPHDINVKEVGPGKTRIETAAGMGLRFKPVSRIGRKMDAIEMARQLLDHVKFDEVRCEQGIIHLEQYRKKWNALQNGWSDDPAQTGDQHAADAFMTFAQGYDGKWGTKPILTDKPKDGWCGGRW